MPETRPLRKQVTTTSPSPTKTRQLFAEDVYPHYEAPEVSQPREIAAPSSSYLCVWTFTSDQKKKVCACVSKSQSLATGTTAISEEQEASAAASDPGESDAEAEK